MKFTKEEVLEQIKANLGQTRNISDRSISEQIDTLLPLLSNDETEMVDFVSKVMPIFNTANLNIKNDVSVGIKNFKDNYTPETPITTPPKQVVQPQQNRSIDDELIKKIQTVESEIASFKRANFMAEVHKIMESNGCASRPIRNVVLQGIEISDNDTPEKIAERYRTSYDEKFKEFYGDSAKPNMGNGGGYGNPSKIDGEAEVARLKQSGLWTE